MKTVLLFISFLASTIAYSQTNIIAAKSHSAQPTIELSDPDNFGEFIPPREVESVTYIKEDCIVEKYKVEWKGQTIEYDTICNHPFLSSGQIDIGRIKAMYPDKTKFIGFDQLKKNEKAIKKKTKKETQNQKGSAGMLIFLLGTGLFLIYVFIPKISISKS